MVIISIIHLHLFLINQKKIIFAFRWKPLYCTKMLLHSRLGVILLFYIWQNVSYQFFKFILPFQWGITLQSLKAIKVECFSKFISPRMNVIKCAIYLKSWGGLFVLTRWYAVGCSWAHYPPSYGCLGLTFGLFGIDSSGSWSW